MDTIYAALENTDAGSSLADLLANGDPNLQRTPVSTTTTTSSSLPKSADSYFKDAVLLSRSQAKEVARILFLSDRARPVVHASPNAAQKDAYFVNKQLSDLSEVTVTRTEIDEILHAFEQPEAFEILSSGRPKNLIDDFNSISNG